MHIWENKTSYLLFIPAKRIKQPIKKMKQHWGCKKKQLVKENKMAIQQDTNI